MEKCKILGVNISVTTMEDVVEKILNNIDSYKGKYICVANVHTTVMAYENEKYKKIQNTAVMALPDGRPLSIISQSRGYHSVERVTGPDLMGEMFQTPRIRHFFYGSTKETLEQLQKGLKKEYPDIQIADAYAPPFRKLSEEEDLKIINLINSSNSDIVWVGLGAPKQEEWMYEHQNKINALMIGVGAGFDYYAGNIKRAPLWMQKYSLEWLYRLAQEPRRLFKRYLITNIKFIKYILQENLFYKNIK